MPDGAFSSAPRTTVFGPACVSSIVRQTTRMKLSALLVTVCLALSACRSERAVRVTSSADLEHLVGHRVELVGVVSGDIVPQICGVDLWGMNALRGKHLRVLGILQRTVFQSGAGDAKRAIDSGHDDFIAPVYRGAGTFYRLQDLRYEPSA
jgi:hypothetical protein